MFKLRIALVLVFFFVFTQIVKGQDIPSFPPYVLSVAGAPAYPRPGDCAFIKTYEPAEHRVKYCMRGYVTWLVNQPTAYYLEKADDSYIVLIWNKETIDEYFKH